MTPLQSLQKNGYVHIPSLLTPSDLPDLLATTTHTTQLARAGAWPHFRTVPKQFPPWPSTPPPAEEGGIWGVQHLLHPEMPGRGAFAGVYFSERVLGVVEEILLSGRGRGRRTDTDTNDNNDNDNGEGGEREDEDEPLVMELFNLLVAPETRDFELRWHRDDIPATATPEEEQARLQECGSGSETGTQSHAQYNLALCADSSLVVVPGSHRRVRTETERAAGPYEPELPGQVAVELKPGDAVFYDSNILHRGVYRAKPAGGEEVRLTLHGSVGLRQAGQGHGHGQGRGHGQGQMEGEVRARAVLQHGVGKWVHREDAAFGLGERPERMRRNLVAMGSGEGVGYSLQE